MSLFMHFIFLKASLTSVATKLRRSLKLQRFLSEDPSLNFNFPHKMKSSTGGKFNLSPVFKTIFNNKVFPFSFENLFIFEDILRIWNSSKNFWINKDSSYLSSVYFKKPKNLCICLWSIFNLLCNTVPNHW